MLTVYIAQRHFDYEGFNIIGVYTTYELATEAIQLDTDLDMGADSYKVTEHTVKSELN